MGRFLGRPAVGAQGRCTPLRSREWPAMHGPGSGAVGRARRVPFRASAVCSRVLMFTAWSRVPYPSTITLWWGGDAEYVWHFNLLGVRSRREDGEIGTPEAKQPVPEQVVPVPLKYHTAGVVHLFAFTD